MLAGGLPTAIGASRVSSVALITDTVFSPLFVTYARVASFENTICTGARPTGIVAPVVLLAVSITVTVFAVVLATYALDCAWASVAAGPVQMKNEATQDKVHNPNRTRRSFVRVIADSFVGRYASAYTSPPLIA